MSSQDGQTKSISGSNPEPDEIEEMIDEADADGSGSINFPEFIELMLKKQAGSQTKEEIKQVKMTNFFRHIVSKELRLLNFDRLM